MWHGRLVRLSGRTFLLWEVAEGLAAIIDLEARELLLNVRADAAARIRAVLECVSWALLQLQQAQLDHEPEPLHRVAASVAQHSLELLASCCTGDLAALFTARPQAELRLQDRPGPQS